MLHIPVGIFAVQFVLEDTEYNNIPVYHSMVDSALGH